MKIQLGERSFDRVKNTLDEAKTNGKITGSYNLGVTITQDGHYGYQGETADFVVGKKEVFIDFDSVETGAQIMATLFEGGIR